MNITTVPLRHGPTVCSSQAAIIETMATLRPLRARGGSSLWRLSMAAILGVLAIDVDAAIDTAGSASALRADYASTRAARSADRSRSSRPARPTPLRATSAR
jgi:hypothetical protein